MPIEILIATTIISGIYALMSRSVIGREEELGWKPLVGLTAIGFTFVLVLVLPLELTQPVRVAYLPGFSF